ncbi:helix-turn-helix domain-containing protein [Halocatena marina]|uniref:helix-turn-helix domain-containing protein n=1 Tax=Halocatena marina TaxID=2934937 RepID=UPI00200C0C4D|nr:helix-turn-helix domain-containing protein [Halocatena marina]
MKPKQQRDEPSASTGAPQHESATLVTARIPAEEFALHETFTALSELRFECSDLVATGNEAVMPLMWAQTDDYAALESAMAADPSVNAAEEIIHADDRRLYRIHWQHEVHLLCQIILNSEVILLDGYGTDDQWTFELLFSSRQALQRTCECCQQYNLTYTIDRIRGLGDDTSESTPLGLTAEQHEALAEAHKRGYFSVPRQITLDELADILDISHQALSERLRRGHDALIRETFKDPSLGFGSNPDFGRASDTGSDSGSTTDTNTNITGLSSL